MRYSIGFRAFTPFMNQADAGGSGGGADGAGAGNGGGSSAQPNQGGAPAGSAPITLSDDTMIAGPDGKPVKWGEYRSSQFVPRSEYDGYAKSYGAKFQENLRNLAQKVKAGGRVGQQPQQGAPAGLNLDDIRNLPLVDGATAARIYEQGVGPVQQALTQQQQVINKLTQVVQQLQGGMGTVAEKHSAQEFDKLVGSAIGNIGVEGLDPQDEFVRELAQDVYHSYEWQGKEAVDFPKFLKARYDSAVAHVRRMDKARVTAAKANPTKFLRPGGSASPSGAGTQKVLSSREIARQMFAGENTANT